MSLDLSLYTIESDLANLVEMREQAQARVVANETRTDDEITEEDDALGDPFQELKVIDDQIREYVTAEIRKVDNIRSFWRHCELMRDAAKEEARVQSERSKAWGARLDRLKATCALVMEYPNTLTLTLGLTGMSAQAVATPGVPATGFLHVTRPWPGFGHGRLTCKKASARLGPWPGYM